MGSNATGGDGPTRRSAAEVNGPARRSASAYDDADDNDEPISAANDGAASIYASANHDE